MADFQTPQKPAEKISGKKKHIRIDMTPMVDLGFLLITFFMFAASFSKPNVMDLGLPAKGETPPAPNDIRVENQVTIILGANDQVFYYQNEVDHLSPADLHRESLEGLQVAKLIKQLKKVAPKPEIFTVIIKPTDDSTYKNFVDLMDEIAISGHEIYGVTELKPKEKEILKQVTEE